MTKAERNAHALALANWLKDRGLTTAQMMRVIGAFLEAYGGAREQYDKEKPANRRSTLQ
jgi:hypothetical protein